MGDLSQWEGITGPEVRQINKMCDRPIKHVEDHYMVYMRIITGRADEADGARAEHDAGLEQPPGF